MKSREDLSPMGTHPSVDANHPHAEQRMDFDGQGRSRGATGRLLQPVS